MSTTVRKEALERSRLINRHPERVTAQLFVSGPPFFLALDKVQVRYEMLRSHAVEGVPISTAALDHGYSRAGFYLVQEAFSDKGMAGLIDERPGRRGPVKLTEEILIYLRSAPKQASGATLAEEVEARFGVRLHRRTVERARGR